MPNKNDSRQQARALLTRLGDIHLTVQRAWDALPEDDRVCFEREMKGKKSYAVQGILGEVLGLRAMYLLSEASAGSFTICSGVPGQKTTSPTGYSVLYQKSGKNIVIADSHTGTQCEIDNLGMCAGIPIIFESKSGDTKVSWKDVVWQQHFVERAFGDGEYPFFVEIRTERHQNLEYLGRDRYRAIFPVLDEIREKALCIASREWTVK